MTVLEDLWYGNINPHETFVNGNRNFNHLLSLMGKNRNKLSESLTDQQKETLSKYDDAVNKMHSLTEQSAFQYVLSLGARLMVESISPKLPTDNE